MRTLLDLGEDALIARLVSLAPRAQDPAAGPGDDCAVIDPGPSHSFLQLLKTDALVGHIHFLPNTPARAVGWKAAARVVSDFAAMGGHPDRVLVTLALPPETLVTWVEDLYRGISDCLIAFNAVLAGGETSSSPPGSPPFISIAASGRVLRSHLVLRSSAKPHNLLFVTASLGGSILGKHLSFTPRIKEAYWLVSKFKPTAMMDLSDGLAKDLPRLAAASGCGFVLDEAALPLSPSCSIRQALTDGEDYELLFAIEPERAAALLESWPAEFPELTMIGRLVEAGSGEALGGGWDHFGAHC